MPFRVRFYVVRIPLPNNTDCPLFSEHAKQADRSGDSCRPAGYSRAIRCAEARMRYRHVSRLDEQPRNVTVPQTAATLADNPASRIREQDVIRRGSAAGVPRPALHTRRSSEILRFLDGSGAFAGVSPREQRGNVSPHPCRARLVEHRKAFSPQERHAVIALTAHRPEVGE